MPKYTTKVPMPGGTFTTHTCTAANAAEARKLAEAWRERVAPKMNGRGILTTDGGMLAAVLEPKP